jgi:hypothetical protein
MARPFSSTSKGGAPGQAEKPREIIFPAEVMEVMLSESHPEFKNSLGISIGAIRGRRYDTQKGNAVETLSWYNPIDPSDLKIPLIGEAVLLVETPNKGIVNSKSSKDFCYISTVGIFGAISHNAIPGLADPLEGGGLTSFTGNMGPTEDAQVGEYAPQLFIPPLVAFEGDRIIQGRWGNSIRFSNTSNGSDDISFWNNSGTDGDPITILSNGIDDPTGLMRVEDLNNGSANIILSSTQELDIEASNKLPTGYPKLNQYAASQIVMSADKIVLNSMEDTIVISSKKGVSISTPEWKADFTEMMDIMKGLLAEMKAQAEGSSPFVTGVGPTGLNPLSLTVLTILETRLGMLEQ